MPESPTNMSALGYVGSILLLVGLVLLLAGFGIVRVKEGKIDVGVEGDSSKSPAGSGKTIVAGVLMIVIGFVCLLFDRVSPSSTSTSLATALPTPTYTSMPPTSKPPVAPALADTWTRPADGMVMVYVSGDFFQMGSKGSDPNADGDEFPQHSVTLDGFWIDRTEVTNAHYARCVTAGACSVPPLLTSLTRSSYYGNSQYDNHPVIYVNWDDATTYCRWVGGRLPTEAEWEYAARGPDSRIYPWGDSSPDDTLLNYNSTGGDTTRVSSYPNGASWCGALDMAGNVWEWVADWYDVGYYANSSAHNPTGPGGG